MKPKCGEKWPGSDTFSVSGSNLSLRCSCISTLGFRDIPVAWLLMIKACFQFKKLKLNWGTCQQRLLNNTPTPTRPCVSISVMSATLPFLSHLLSSLLLFFLLLFLSLFPPFLLSPLPLPHHLLLPPLLLLLLFSLFLPLSILTAPPPPLLY